MRSSTLAACLLLAVFCAGTSFATKRPIAKAKCKAALLLIDIQNCFMPGAPQATLAVTDGTAIIPVVNKLRDEGRFPVIALTQDFHPKGHVSFASSHYVDGAKPAVPPFEVINVTYDKNGALCGYEGRWEATSDCKAEDAPFKTIPQVLWPDHCVEGTAGADFYKGLKRAKTDVVVQKGVNDVIDGYSGFFDNGRVSKTTLDAQLRRLGVTKVYVAGLAEDFCVNWSSLDADDLGYETVVVKDATRGITPEGVKAGTEKLLKAGVKILNSTAVLALRKAGRC